ncbi:MAG: Mur ligase domain-containing protein [Bacteroidota bacterium]|nr:Mur ligase domain-containing protein [Bacteroidota bacterium]
MKVHFIAIGGSAMHNLALALSQKGHQVTGSDDEIFEPSRSRLAAAGILPKSMGWSPDRISEDLDMVVLGMHAHADNPELAKAREIGVPVLSYPEFLYQQSKDKTRVVIAGSHGKTTITSMILHVLNEVGRKEDFMVGALLDGYDTMVRITPEAEFMILEGDEYLSSALDRRPKFLHYRPNIALISGIAWDHINVFPTFDNYLEQFALFLDSMESGGAVIYNAEDPAVVQLVEGTKNTIKKFPYRTPEYHNEGGITYLETFEGSLPLQIFGPHNLLNLEGARLICNQLGVMDEDFYDSIATFSGARNRLQRVSQSPEGVIFKDFAHAPSKVEATVEAVAKQFPDNPVVAVLELHTYSSLNPEFIPQYKGTLNNADHAVVFYDPHALEIKRLPALSAEKVRQYFGREDIIVVDDPEKLSSAIPRFDGQKPVYLFMSSGNFGGLDLRSILSSSK